MPVQLRSSTPKAEVKPVTDNAKPTVLPYIKYEGKIKYYTTFIDCAHICDQLLAKVIKADETLVIGFDMEWPFSFQTGPGKTALIQISPFLQESVLLHITNFQKLPKTLIELLSHPNIRLTGVNIKNDIRKLARDFRAVPEDAILNNCIELGSLAKNFFLNSRSMQAMVNNVFKMQINKSKSVRMSKWNVVPLSRTQQQYAALDSYVSLKLYLHFKDLEDKRIKQLHMA